MVKKIILKSGRGTKMYRNGDSKLEISIDFKDGMDNLSSEIHEMNLMYIIGTSLKYDKVSNLFTDLKNAKITIPAKTEYMIVNTTHRELILNLSNDTEDQYLVYDPYLYESEDHKTVDSEEFKQNHDIHPGYIDILAKWYSIKFTYPNENLIFIRPGLGISYQTHKMRQERWKVETGHPIIISGDKVIYNTNPGDEFEHPVGGIHTIINPTNDWISITETYNGEFDEEDISRIFNPNKYGI